MTIDGDEDVVSDAEDLPVDEGAADVEEGSEAAVDSALEATPVNQIFQ